MTPFSFDPRPALEAEARKVHLNPCIDITPAEARRIVELADVGIAAENVVHAGIELETLVVGLEAELDVMFPFLAIEDVFRIDEIGVRLDLLGREAPRLAEIIDAIVQRPIVLHPGDVERAVPFRRERLGPVAVDLGPRGRDEGKAIEIAAREPQIELAKAVARQERKV